MAVMPRILLVRHGQSLWNAEGKWQGQADIELSELGRRQARAAAANLGNFDIVASSTLARAAETAYILSSELGIGPIHPMPDLIERSAGEWSGLTRSDIERDWPGYLARDGRPPSYENDDDLWIRVERGLLELGAMLGDDPQAEALLVAHGGIIYMLEERRGKSGGRIANLGAVWVTIDNGDISVGERVELIDEAELLSAQSQDIL